MAGPGDLRRAPRRPARRGLLVVGAAEVATLAGGLRRGACAGRPGDRPARDRDRLPGRADRRGRGRGGGRGGAGGRARGGRARPAARSTSSTPPAARSRRGSSTRTPTSCSPDRARTRSRCGRGAPPTSRSSPPAAGSSPRSRATRAASEQAAARPRAALARRRCCATGTTTVEAKSGYGLDARDGAAAPGRRRPAGGRGPGRRHAHLPRRPRGAAGGPGGPSGDPAAATEAYVADGHRGAAAGRRRAGDRAIVRRLLRGGRLLAPTRRAGSCSPPARSGSRSGSTPTSWRPPAARSLPRSSARSRPTTSGAPSAAGIAALAAAATGARRPVVAVLLRPCPGSWGSTRASRPAS